MGLTKTCELKHSGGKTGRHRHKLYKTIQKVKKGVIINSIHRNTTAKDEVNTSTGQLPLERSASMTKV